LTKKSISFIDDSAMAYFLGHAVFELQHM